MISRCGIIYVVVFSIAIRRYHDEARINKANEAL